ncbi:MAG TPA: NAD(P)-dependent oxidoreductase [Dongiaceae bacterium]|nr:NAD(P)-dependent oxidoreductase [Dongiaceae bacterium]
MSSKRRIGFIGLGTMGAPMAANLVKAGHAVRGYDLDPARMALVPGLDPAGSAADCALGAEMVMTSLPGPRQFQALMENSLAAALEPGTILVDLTTNDLSLIRDWAERLKEKRVAVLDAPVTGAVDGAIAGRLTLFVGGDKALYDSVLPVLQAISAKAIHGGPLGAGNVIKLVTNQLWFVHAATIGEGLLLGKKAGVDLVTLWDAIKSSVGTSFVAEHDVPSIFAGHYDPSFTLDLCLKDLGLIIDLSHAVETPVPMTEQARARFELAREAYGGKAAELHVAKLLEDASGSDLRADGDWRPHWASAPHLLPTH